jgi:uncharacterized protein with HEPN domain
MSKDPIILLKFILESIESLQRYMSDISEQFYVDDIEKQDAAEHRLQVIGQAIIQLPQEIKDAHPEIEWHKIAGLRNRIVHEYLDIDHDLIWHIIDESVPEFKIQITKLVEENKK